MPLARRPIRKGDPSGELGSHNRVGRACEGARWREERSTQRPPQLATACRAFTVALIAGLVLIASPHRTATGRNPRLGTRTITDFIASTCNVPSMCGADGAAPSIAPTTQQHPPARLRRRRRADKSAGHHGCAGDATLLVGLAISAVFLYLAFRNIDLSQLGAALGRVRLGWLLMAIGLSLLIMVLPRLALAARAAAARAHPARPPVGGDGGRLHGDQPAAGAARRGGAAVAAVAALVGVSFSNVVGNLVVEKTMDAVVTLFYILAGLVTIEQPARLGAHRRHVPGRRRGACW